jgi:hypothetical protein
MAATDDHVRGMGETLAQAEKGMKLFAKEETVERDIEGATAFKAEFEEAITVKEAEAAALTGKDNKKARTEKSKEASAMKNDKKYIDACKVVKGLDAPNGNFMRKVAAEAPKIEETPAEEKPAEEKAEKKKEDKKEDKKPKKQESAGLSKAEKDELEQLKQDIIKRKAELKEQGMSGGQCNKDEQVVAWVNRMTELKIKEDPSLADAGKKDKKDEKKKVNQSEEKLKLAASIEEYRLKLKQEYGYSDKDIKADPDFQDMQKEYNKMK